MLEPLPDGTPLRLTLYQPAVVAAARRCAGETIHTALWVASGESKPRADSAASVDRERREKTSGYFSAIFGAADDPTGRSSEENWTAGGARAASGAEEVSGGAFGVAAAGRRSSGRSSGEAAGSGRGC